MPLQRKGKYGLMDNPWMLPPDRLRHVNCRWMLNWIRQNKAFLDTSGCSKEYIENSRQYIEHYDPFRTLSLICEWYDYCRKYDESKRHCISYRIRYNTKFVDTKYEKNHPATFKYPLYSLMGDWKMFWDMLWGKN